LKKISTNNSVKNVEMKFLETLIKHMIRGQRLLPLAPHIFDSDWGIYFKESHLVDPALPCTKTKTSIMLKGLVTPGHLCLSFFFLAGLEKKDCWRKQRSPYGTQFPVSEYTEKQNSAVGLNRQYSEHLSSPK
jgi:hypothetical protein